MPALAPGALDPVDPILFSTPCSATGLSLAMKFASEPVPRLDSLEGSVGRARHDERHRTVAAARPENDRGRIIFEEDYCWLEIRGSNALVRKLEVALLIQRLL